MGVKVVLPTYRDENGKLCRRDYYIQVCSKGKRSLRRVGTREEAYAKKKEIEDQMKAGTYTVPVPEPESPPAERKTTFREYVEKWMAGTVAKNLKRNTARYYTDMLKRIPDEIQDRPFEEITREDVQKVVYAGIDAGLARSTAMGIIRTVSAIYGYAADDGVYSGANIAAKPSRILRQDNGSEEVEDDQIDQLDRPESEKLLAAVAEHYPTYYPIFLMALRSSARQGELVGLKWDDIDWEGRYITIRRTIVEGKEQGTKNRQMRRIPRTPQLVDVLKAHQRAQGKKPQVSPWVFQNTVGGTVDPSKLRKVHVDALKEAGLRYVEFRSLRNTALTLMADSGVQITALQRIAGHSSIEVTAKHYLKVKPEAHAATISALATMDSVWNANGDANGSGNVVILEKSGGV